jgi:hypothetical protein
MEYAILTDEISRAWSNMTTRQYKNYKGLTKESLRDNMSTLELVLNMLAEATTTELSKEHCATVIPSGAQRSRGILCCKAPNRASWTLRVQRFSRCAPLRVLRSE